MHREGELSWGVHVTTAHEDCQLDPDEWKGHNENGCVLFPEVRTYRWLLEKKQEMDDLGIHGAYEMRYLNKPIPTTGIVFRMPEIREHALDRSRGIGVNELPAGRMIAGLDPAPRGTQAAVLWLWAAPTLYLVDIETQEAGGFEGARDVMARWHQIYELDSWVYEDNMSKDEFFKDVRFQELKRELGLTVRHHTTGKNKHDPQLGISAMAPLYHDGTINLPYGTSEARAKVNMFLRQLELWTTDGLNRSKNAKTDVKMASWLPFPRLLRWMREDTVQTKINAHHDTSYPMSRGPNQVPWKTPYPRGR